MSLVRDFVGGVNWRLPPWHPEMEERKQHPLYQNFRYKNSFMDAIPGTRKYHGISLGTDPITALMPYYNDQTNYFALLAATSDKILRRNPVSNEFETLLGGLTKNSIFSSVIRNDVMYIPSVKDGLKKYSGGTVIETVGTVDTAPGSFRILIYMKEIDRMFGISDDAIYGQITWCDLNDPEVWDGANVERVKLRDGERVEAAGILYGKLIIFCTYSIRIYYVSGNEENWHQEEAPTTVGCVAPNSLKKVGNEFWFLGEAPQHRLGIYAFNGSTSRLLTDDMSPFFAMRNKDFLRNACAEVHDDVYTISLAIGASQVNNFSLDLDLVGSKADGTPAMYGPHTFAFYSSCVLNDRQNEKQFLMGDQSDGFVYWESGDSLKSVNGIDGQLMENRFISRIHNDKSFEVMKRYKNLIVSFRPRSYFDAFVKTYYSTGTYGQQLVFNPNAQTVGFAGDFNVYQKPFSGTPQLYQFWQPLGLSDKGTSIQIEIRNDVIGRRIAFDEYSYEKTDLYNLKRAQQNVYV